MAVDVRFASTVNGATRSHWRCSWTIEINIQTADELLAAPIAARSSPNPAKNTGGSNDMTMTARLLRTSTRSRNHCTSVQVSSSRFRGHGGIVFRPVRTLLTRERVFHIVRCLENGRSIPGPHQ